MDPEKNLGVPLGSNRPERARLLPGSASAAERVARWSRGLGWVVASSGALSRTLLPAAVLAPVLIGWLCLTGQQRGLFDAQFGVAILTVANILIFVALILRAAVKLGTTDVQRQQATQALQVKDDGGRLGGFSEITPDISERKRSEAQLLELNAALDQQVRERTALLEATRNTLAATSREAEAWFSVVQQHALVSVTNRDGKIIEVNDAFCQISGYGREELLGQDHRLINSGLQARSFWRDMWRTIRAGKPWRHEVRNRAKDGSFYWVDTVIAPVLDDHGEIVKYVSVRFDITQSKRADIAVQVVTQQLKTAQRVSHVGSWELEVATGRFSWSEELYRVMGLPADGPAPDFAAQQRLYTPEAWARLSLAMERAMASGESYELSLDVVRADDGSSRAVVARGEGVLDAAGKLQQLVGTLQDVTEQERAGGELRRLSERLWLATSAANLGVWDWSIPDNVLVWDEMMHRLYGTRPDNFREPYETWRDALHPADAPAAEAALQAAVRGECDFNTTFRILRRDGAIRYLRAAAIVNRNPATGQALRMVGVNWDITEQRAAEGALVELNRLLVERSTQAESTNTAKSMFLANMSHEIRTPLNALVGLTYLLEQSQLDAGQVGLVGKIKLASRSLLGVVNNVLDLTKIEAGELQVEEAYFHLRSLMDELLSVMQVPASANRIGLALECDPALPRVLLGDGLHLRQILTNLLSNAIKFSAGGRVTLSVSLRKSVAARATLRFTVNDTGIGMDPVVLERIFTPFTQADTSTTRRFGGTGLGLSIVKRLVALMDGKVAVSSTLGVGSEFVVELPFGIEEHVRSGPTRPLEVLVVGEDSGFCAQLLGMARALGWHATSKEAGLRSLESLESNLLVAENPVEVLILALGASDTQSAQTLLAVQAIASELRPAVVVAHAGTASSYDEAALHYAINTTLVRGAATTSSLFDAVQEAVAARASTKASSVPKVGDAGLRAAGLQGKRLLVVDDSDINLEIAARILELEGAHVTSRANGQEAVDLLRLHPREFDAVLMDVQMPVLDGVDATIYIRTVLGLSSLPIFALTAGALVSERQRAKAAGMNEFITKPFEPHAMIKKVVEHLSRLDSSPPSSRMSSDRSPALPEGWPIIAGVDAHQAFACVGGDQLLLTHMLQKLLEQFADLELPMARASQVQGAAALAARLHKLSGIASTLGAAELGTAARAWDHALRSEAQDGVEALSLDLARELIRLRVSVAPTLALASQRLTPAVKDALEVVPRDAKALSLDLDELNGLLERQSFTALKLFASLVPELRVELGNEAFAALDCALNEFRYEAALQMLQAVPHAAGA